MVVSLVNNASNNLKKVFDAYNEKRKRYTEQDRSKMIRQYQIGKIINFFYIIIII